MKPLPLLLLLCASVQASDLRMIGTNLYDFSSAGINSCYRIRAKVSKIYPQSTEIITPYLFYERYVFPAPGASALASSLLGSSDLMAMKAGNQDAIQRGVAVARMINELPHKTPSSPPITLHQYSALDPAMKNNYREITIYATNYLLHCSNSKVGSIVDCFAVPTKYRGFYDCGIPFTGEPNEFKIIYRVLLNGIIAVTNLPFTPSALSTNIFHTVTNHTN